MPNRTKELKRRLLTSPAPGILGEYPKSEAYVDSRERFILKSLFTIDLRSDYFYASLEDVLYAFTYFLSALYLDNPEETLEAIKIAKEKAHRKASILVAAQIMEQPHIVELLGDFPVKSLLTFAHIARKYKTLGGGLGYRKKRSLEKILVEMPIEKTEFYAIKTPKAFRRLLRLVHPRGYKSENEPIRRRLTRKIEPPTERIRAYVCVAKGECGTETIIEYNLPREVVRRRGLKDVDVRRLVEIMSSTDIAMQAATLARYIPEDELVKIVESRKFRAYHAARAFIGLRKKYPKLAEAFLRIAEEKRPKIGEDYEVLIDVSGSMYSILLNASFKATLYLLSKEAKKIHAFNSCIGLKEVSKDEILELRGDCCTPLIDSINELSRKASASTLILFTDEQENVSIESSPNLAAREKVIVINPSAYNISYIDEVAETVILKAMGKTIDDVMVSIKLSERLKRTAGKIESLLKELRGF